MSAKKPMRRWMKTAMAEAKRCDVEMPWARTNRRSPEMRRGLIRVEAPRLVAAR